MTTTDVDTFFADLDRRILVPIQVILTGGAAAVLRGSQRATYDIDFEIKMKNVRHNTPTQWQSLQNALTLTGRATGITPQYDENIDRWNTIPMPSRKSQRYKRIGKVDILLLDPGLWAIGKLTRYLSSDVRDLRDVLSKTKSSPDALVRLWGRALKDSPSSNMQALFRRQVENFISSYGRDIWGTNVSPDLLKKKFLSSARKG